MALFAISCNARGVIYNIPRDLSEDPVAHAHRARIFGIIIAVFLTVIFGIALIYFCQSYWNKRQVHCANSVLVITDRENVVNIDITICTFFFEIIISRTLWC
ncbi:unnamed protein product [Rotaria sp. Silwood1]|nr:unnamed protein product [Rotaria sp. Silwood1]